MVIPFTCVVHVFFSVLSHWHQAMEHRTAATPNDGGRPHKTHNSSTLQHHPTLLHQPADSFSSGSSSHKSRTHVMCQNPLLTSYKGEATNNLSSDLSNYLHYPSLDGSFGSGFAEQGNYGNFPKPGVLPAMPCTSPEALLNILSSVQGKLKHLEAILQLMIHERRQQGMHQSLTVEFTSIMSQLFGAMSSNMGQQPSWSPFQVPSHGNDTFEISFNGFNEGDANNALSAPLSDLMGGLQANLNPSAGVGRPAFTGGMPVSSTGRVGNTELGTLAKRPKQVGSIVSFSGALNLGNTHAHSFKLDSTKMAPSSAVEGVNGHSPLGDAHSLKPDVTKANTTSGVVEVGTSHGIGEVDDHVMISADDQKEEDDDGEGESLPPGSYDLIEMAATEILAEHTHFCEICSKGFKRDANLRMHMRGHGDEYKTPAALARPDKATRDPSTVKPRRYSCPYAGCKRNKKHPKFQPLKTMLCVKNHYKRSHCPKLLVCSRCKTKKFSVVADLKTHEKHCGQDKWQCSCGTTFSRKDKLLGHIGLFAGHTPAVPAQELESPTAGVEASTDGYSTGHVEGMESSTYNKPVFSTKETSANDVAVVDARVHVNGHFVGQSSAQQTNDRNLSFASLANGGLLRDYPYPSTDGVTSDASEFQGLLSDSFFQQGESSN